MALGVLLIAEILALTIRFDPPQGLSPDRWWAIPLFYSHSIIQFALLLTVSVGVMGGLRVVHRFRRALFLDHVTDYSWSRSLLIHGLCLISLTVLTASICEGGVLTSAVPGPWMLAWMLSVVATVVTWLTTVISPSSWLEILKRSRRSIVLGAAIAGVAFGLGNGANLLWAQMAGVTLILVRAALQLISSHVIYDPAGRIIGVDGFQVIIGDQCSGYEGIGLVVAFLLGYFWAFRRSIRWPQAYYLIAAGVVSIWLLNVARIVTLVLIGAWGSPDVAIGGFHSQAGWLSFLAVSLGLVAVSKRSSFFAADPDRPDVASRSNPSLAFLGPFLMVLASALVTSALSSGFDALYGLRVFTGGSALWYFRREFAGLIGNGSWVGVAIGVVAFVLWVALEPASTGVGRALASTVGDLPRAQGWAWIALRIIGSVAIVPLVEELAFRGYLIRRLGSSDFQSVPLGRFAWVPLLVSSAAFGLLHGRWLAGMLVGILYGLALARRGKLGDAIVAHAVTNALIAATVLATGDWTMWT